MFVHPFRRRAAQVDRFARPLLGYNWATAKNPTIRNAVELVNFIGGHHVSLLSAGGCAKESLGGGPMVT